MEFVIGTAMLVFGIITSPFLSIKPISMAQLVVSGLLTGLGFIVTLHSLPW